MKAFVLTTLPSSPIQSSAQNGFEKSYTCFFISNKNLRLTSKHLPSKNTSSVYSSHSECINSGWTKGGTENVNRLYLGLRCWTHCGKRRNPSCTYRPQSVSESALFLWLCYLHSVYLWVFICETRVYVPYNVRCVEESVT